MYRQNSKCEWSSEDRQNFGRVIRTLEELDTRIPREDVVSRLDMNEIRSEVRNAAIRTWRRKVSVQESKY
jgi:hypothetical protein